jgi:hypothetical protein
VDPDVAELLLVVTLCEAGLGFVRFDLYDDVTEGNEGGRCLPVE